MKKTRPQKRILKSTTKPLSKKAREDAPYILMVNGERKTIGPKEIDEFVKKTIEFNEDRVNAEWGKGNHRVYNKPFLEIKWWLQEHEVLVWAIAGVLLGFLFAVAFAYFNGGI